MNFTEYSLLILSIVALTACTGSKKLSDTDLNSIESSLVRTDSDPSHYLLTLSGFNEIKEDNYQTTINRMNEYPKDVLEIIENSVNDKPTISVKIAGEPKSLNRILWGLGEDHYRKHRIKLEKPDPSSISRENLPEIVGGLYAIQQELNYPPELKRANIQGRVFVKFVVNDFGEVETPDILESLHASADAEVIRVIRNAKFKPGMMDGVPISVDFIVSLNFRK